MPFYHLDPATSLLNYDDSQVEPELVGTFQDDTETFNTLINSIDQSLLNPVVALNDDDVDDIMAFLSALTDPSSINLKDLVPDELPSGLPLND